MADEEARGDDDFEGKAQKKLIELGTFGSKYEGAAAIMEEKDARGDEFKKKVEKKLSGWGIFGSKYEGAAAIMEEKEARGDEFKKKAEKKLSGWGFFGPNYEDAADLYFKAASCYELANTWEKAASAFMKLAGIRIKLERKIEAATAYSSASASYQKFSMPEAAQALNESVKILLEIGRLDIASRYSKDLGELYVASHVFKKAMVPFERAAAFYQKEEELSYFIFCKQRIAQLAAQLEQYPKAVEIYEEMARQLMDNSLLKCSVKAILLNAGICQLCKNDSVAIANSLEQYQEIDPTFSGTHEYKLLTELATSMEEEYVEKFTAAINEYENMTHLDTWKMTLLSRLKTTLQTNKLKVKKENEEAVEGEEGAESQVDEEVKNESDEVLESKDGEGKIGTNSQANEEVPESKDGKGKKGTKSQANVKAKKSKSQANEEVPESKDGKGKKDTKSQAIVKANKWKL